MMNSKKIIYRMINEALGVPEGVLDASEELYDQILSKIHKLKKDKKETSQESEIKFKSTYVINDYVFKKVKLVIKIQAFPDLDEIILTSMAVGALSEMDDDTFKLKHLKTTEISLIMIFVAKPDWTPKDIEEYIIENKEEVLSNLSHELKHAYDTYKTPTSDIRKRAEYSTYSDLKFGIDPIDKVIHDMYYIQMVENLVRPTEIAARLRHNKITQKEFLNFLLNDTTYKKLKRISEFNYIDFRNSLKDYIPKIDKYLEHFNESDNHTTDDEKIDWMLNIVMINLNNMKGDNLKKFLIKSIPEAIFGFQGEKKEFFNNFVKHITKFDNPKDFFNYEEKKFKYYSNKMIKKIAKLYDYIDRDRKVQESIINWELYHRANKTEEKNPLVKELKYPKKSSPPKKIKDNQEKNYIKGKIYKKI